MRPSRHICCNRNIAKNCSAKLIAILSLGLIFLAGCSGGAEGEADRPETHKVTGKVTYKSAPVEGATVIFHPDGADGKAASAKTDNTGMFELMTFETGDGAVAGNYKVSITKMSAAAGAAVDMDSPDYVDPGSVSSEKSSEPKHLLPEKYSKPETSGLTATVPTAGELTFDLVD